MSSDSATVADDLLIDYRIPLGVYDEMLTPERSVRATWSRFLEGLQQIGRSGIAQRAEQARRLLRENGVTYNIVGAPEGPDRPWELDPLPFLIAQSEWQVLSAGLQQRARLLNAILADLYGPQRLVRERVMPPAVVFENPNYLVPCHGLVPRGGIHLLLHAANLARQPDGDWRVIADRTQGPSGAGYAVENRVVISRILPQDFVSLHVERLAGFFMALRETLRGLALAQRDNPRVVLLSPGTRSSRYFEDGYLARYLGYALVEGGDLTVRGDKVYLKTLGGLLPVDVILRRILDQDCDPLELSPDSNLGAAGLLQAARGQQLALANAAGSGLLESPVMQAYLPACCQAIFSESLLVQGKPTWWCGDPQSLHYVEAHFSELLIRDAYVHRDRVPFDVKRMAESDRNALLKLIKTHPTRFVAQLPLERSTAPVWNGRGLSASSFVLRTFATFSGGDYRLLPGGLCRVAEGTGSLGDSASSGKTSKDVWILSDRPVETLSLLTGKARAVELRRSANDLPSRVADNLFWLGRYSERAEALLRHLRSCVVRLTNEVEPTSLTELAILVAALEDSPGERTFPDSKQPGMLEQLRKLLLAGVFDRSYSGSLAFILQAFHRIASSARDRISVDSWRIVNQLQFDTQLASGTPSERLGDILLMLNQLLNLLSAFGGLGTESMTRGPGWRFLDMGRRIERATQILGLVRRTLVDSGPQWTALLEAILEIADSSMTYRNRYLASLELAPLLDLILIDETNPRAVGFQLNALSEHVHQLSSDLNDSHVSPEQRIMLDAQSVLRLTDVEALVEIGPTGQRDQLDRFVRSLEELLRDLSNSISHCYLTHTVPTRQLGSVRAAP